MTRRKQGRIAKPVISERERVRHLVACQVTRCHLRYNLMMGAKTTGTRLEQDWNKTGTGIYDI